MNFSARILSKFCRMWIFKKKSGLEKLKSGSKRGGLAGPTRMGGASLHFSNKRKRPILRISMTTPTFHWKQQIWKAKRGVVYYDYVQGAFNQNASQVRLFSIFLCATYQTFFILSNFMTVPIILYHDISQRNRTKVYQQHNKKTLKKNFFHGMYIVQYKLI